MMTKWCEATVAWLRPIATDVMDLGVRLAEGADLVDIHPGTHVDLELPNGLIRQYSIHAYDTQSGICEFGVGLAAPSRGGSKFVHDQLKVGQPLRVGRPRNHFELDPDAPGYFFIAGGIGITPILSMIRWCRANGRAWRLLYCVRSRSRAAYLEELQRDGDVHLHADDEQSGQPDLSAFVTETDPQWHLYCCGPAGLMSVVEQTAVPHFGAARLHFERFSPSPESVPDLPVERRSFIAKLSETGMEIEVPADLTLLEAMERAGVDWPYSCREGMCRTCECSVLEGEVEHLDFVLSDDERSSNEIILPCVSRAKSDSLVLDI